LKDLDATNPQGMKPSKFTSFGAGVSAAIVLICVPFAWGAAPGIPVTENPIVRLLLMMLTLSLALSIISIVCKWDWKIKYFGFSMLSVGSISLLALVPLLAVLVFGVLSWSIKLLISIFYIGSHVWWCRKFFVLYDQIFNDEGMRNILYEEDVDAFYYKRRGDSYLLEKRFKFSQMPSGSYFGIFILLGLMLLPLIGTVRNLTGVPFAHVFLTIAMLPVSWMGIGLAIRGLLVCYHYPARIRRITGKEVYVDLTGSYVERKRR
jgi:hypothetical protein